MTLAISKVSKPERGSFPREAQEVNAKMTNAGLSIAFEKNAWFSLFPQKLSLAREVVSFAMLPEAFAMKALWAHDQAKRVTGPVIFALAKAIAGARAKFKPAKACVLTYSNDANELVHFVLYGDPEEFDRAIASIPQSRMSVTVPGVFESLATQDPIPDHLIAR